VARRTKEANAQYQREYRARKAAERAEAAGETPKKPAAPRTPRGPRPRSARRHRDAVTKMLRTTGLGHVADEAPLVQLVKDLAYDLDTGAGNEVYAKYLAALKDVRRVLAYSARPQKLTEPIPPAAAPVEPEDDGDELATVDELEAFRTSRGIG